MEKIAIIGDIHANTPALEHVLLDTKERQVSHYIFLGDYILDGFDNQKVLENVKKYGDLVVICGNKEEFYLKDPPENWYTHDQFRNMVYTLESLTQENLDYIRSLPSYQTVKVEETEILACHGSPYSCRDKYVENGYALFDQLIENFDFDIFLTAHTHVGFHTYYRHRHFINPSSVGMPLDGPGIKYGILTVDGKNVEYEPVCLSYDYTAFSHYYKESLYYEKVNTWAKLSLMNIKDGYNYTQDFIDRVYTISKERMVDTKDGIPNALWNEEYKKFVKEKKLDSYI